jgi:hypothetical protein
MFPDGLNNSKKLLVDLRSVREYGARFPELDAVDIGQDFLPLVLGQPEKGREKPVKHREGFHGERKASGGWHPIAFLR